MTPFDLLFIVAFLASIAAVLRLGYLLVRKRISMARRLGLKWGIAAVVYFGILVSVSLAQPQRTLPRETPWCFDDWCITVDAVEHPDVINGLKPVGQWVVISMTVSSKMQRGRQSEPDAFVYLRDAAGNNYQPSETGMRALAAAGPAGKPITAFLDPNESIHGSAVFDVPKTAAGLDFIKERRSRFPGMFIIGDPVSLLHRPTVIAVE